MKTDPMTLPPHVPPVLYDIHKLYGHTLAALDGEVGTVKDFYFDDRHWVIRYLVVETGSWLRGREVLLSPHAFGDWNRERNVLSINLTRQQIEGSPSIESHKPVSRQYEIEYYNYYGWPVYWNGGAIWGFGGFPVILPPSKDAMEAHLQPQHPDVHLQSINAVTGYQIHATDGAIGTVSGFRVDDHSWAIAELAVATGHWFSGKEVLIAPSRIQRISYEDSSVYVDLTKADLQRTRDQEEVDADRPGNRVGPTMPS
jgi:hypothetical protein